MKGIRICGDCVNYSHKKHKCLLGCNQESDPRSKFFDDCPLPDVIEIEKVAEILRYMFGDDCACNYNDIDEWLPEVCKYSEKECFRPKEKHACWKEFIKHFDYSLYDSKYAQQRAQQVEQETT